MEDPTDLTDELEDFVHKINQISKSRLMGICVIPGLAIEKTGDVYLRMASSYDKTDEDHGIKKGLWECSGFDCWFDGEDDDSVNDVDVLLESTGGLRWSCRFTLILKDPDHESLAFMIALGDPVLLMGDEEVPCFVNGHDQVVVELDPTNDSNCSYGLWSLLGMARSSKSGESILSSLLVIFAPLGIASDLIRLRVNEIASTLSLFKLMKT